MLSAETHRGNREASGEESYGRFLYNRFRYYDPAIGRYVSADPIGQVGGVNVYGYAWNDPVTWIDPFGLKTRFYISHDRSSIGWHYGSHASVSVDNPGNGWEGPVLYDPAGGYHENERSEDGILGPEDNYSEDAYFDYLADTESTSVTVITFDTTPEQEAALFNAADAKGDPRGVSCAAAVSEVAAQSGAFPGLEGSSFPGFLEDQLSDLPGASVTTVDLTGRKQ